MKPYLYEKLVNYKKEDQYPFHMPGHKRNIENLIINPYTIDITEIDGFDNLNDPQDILKQSMEESAKFYGTKKTFYLVNGSTVGILAAITSVCKRGDKLLMARNCHKAVYNAVRLLELEPLYLPLHYLPSKKVFAGIDEEKLHILLEENPDIKAVIITSPTYEGIVMHIERIKMWIKQYKIPLIVDEAHGAHFPFYEEFPKSAITKGADLVIQSIHKTMPSFTQTALLHLCSDSISEKKLQDCISIYQTSSPSYILMAGIEYAIAYGIEHQQQWKDYYHMLCIYREKINKLRHISLLNKDELQQQGGYDLDPCKLVIFFEDTRLTGNEISEILRTQYHLEMEMSECDYVIAISTICDTKQGFERLYQALFEIDERIHIESKINNKKNTQNILLEKREHIKIATEGSKKRLNPAKALQMEMEQISLQNGKDRICGDYIYIYPPGIPMLVPGEEIRENEIQAMEQYLLAGFYVKGIERVENRDMIKVLKRSEEESNPSYDKKCQRMVMDFIPDLIPI